ncbi:MAG: amidohydrolase family protein [Acidimicrobiia bacterium]|nr:amidohydrolase family protein [Acidimicrobiia bacterium]MBV9040622.1 amidohydrolase family protein [Acidimicrobiia bacterium]
MTTTTPGDGGLFDADGHVLEDVRGIIEKLPEPWHTGRARLLDNDLARLHGMSIFPPLGYLSTIPTAGRSAAATAREPGADGKTPESWEFFLNEVGIEKTVLYPTLGLTVGRLRDPDYAVAVTRAYNDWMAETYLQHPSGKFQAAALLPLVVPSDGADELRRAVQELGFCAAVLPAHGLPNHLGSDMFNPVYEAADELGVALSCHGGAHDGFGFDDFNAFAPVHALGFPFGLLISLGGMLFNKVFERFPNLRVAFLEGGAAWTLMAGERFSESYDSTGSLADRVLQLKEGTSVRDYMAELMHEGRLVIGCEGGEHQLANAVDYFGAPAFMYSSDFPHEVGIASCKHELEELDELELSDDAKQAIRGGTARAFYKLG